MQRIVLFLCLILIGDLSFAQFSVGTDQVICLGDTTQLIATISGPGTSGCNGSIDSLASDIGASNGSNGTMFNIINTSGSDITITGFSQGTYTYSGPRIIDIWYYPGDYVPVISVTAGWTQIATAINSNLPVGATVTAPLYSPVIPITSVIIPAGATYGFYIGANTTLSYATAPAGTISGVSTWGSNSLLTITVGHGGAFPSPTNTPRGPLIKVYYGGGASWYDVSTGQLIGGGDTLYYSPSQTTDIAAVFDCNGQTYTDTMHIDVLNTTISSTGQSLCNGPVVLSVPSGFSAYNWSIPSTSSTLTVSSAGTYYVDCISSTGHICQSTPYTVYSGNIPISLSTPDSVFICQGDVVTIDGPPGYSQYNWSNGASTPSITVNTPGTYSLVTTDVNGCLGISGTTTIEIFPQSISLSVSGGVSLCNGNTPILDAGPGFASYSWVAPGALNGSTSQSITVNIAGDYFVNVTYPTGCTAISDTITIYAAQQQFYFTIGTSGQDSLCMPNGQIILDAGNYASYNWNTGATTQQISTNSLGATYFVNVTDTNGCQGVSNPVFTVYNIVNTSSISGSTIPSQGQSTTYSVIPSFGSTYNWWANSGSIQSGAGTNSVGIVFSSLGSGDIFVVETDANGCIGDTMYLTVNVLPGTAIEEYTETKILNKVINVLGEETTPQNNIPLFYLYKDGTVEKIIIIE